MDLIPAVGMPLPRLCSAITLFTAVRSRVPKVVITRMGLNILINALIGIIPGVGEVFAFWFRPSHRNYELLKKHAPATGSASPSTKERYGLCLCDHSCHFVDLRCVRYRGPRRLFVSRPRAT